MSNKKSGSEAEREFLQLLKENRFWAHKLVENENGAPFDIIAARDGSVYAFEVKDISRGSRFALSRVEDNQRTGFSAWARAGNPKAYFAFRTCHEWILWPSKSVFEQKGTSIDVLDDIGQAKWKEVFP